MIKLIVRLSASISALLNPLIPERDRNKISPSNFSALSIREVMRIKDLIIQSEL